jgi:hypothetical protein
VILLRDVTCIVIGATGMLEQMFIGPVSPILVPAFLAMLLGPAYWGLWAQRKPDGQNITGPSSPSPSAEPQQSSQQQS